MYKKQNISHMTTHDLHYPEKGLLLNYPPNFENGSKFLNDLISLEKDVAKVE